MCLAVPGKILETTDLGLSRVAKVEFGGVTRQVYLDFVPEAQPGDYVLVHVGLRHQPAVGRGSRSAPTSILRQMAEHCPTKSRRIAS